MSSKEEEILLNAKPIGDSWFEHPEAFELSIRTKVILPDNSEYLVTHIDKNKNKFRFVKVFVKFLKLISKVC
jgi:hypothetical protein